MMDKMTWKQFYDTGLLMHVNNFLHIFGWAIVFDFIDGEAPKVYPARVSFRGFSEESQDRSFKKLTRYMAKEAPHIIRRSRGGYIMIIYFAGCFEAMSASRKNILHLPIENRLLSFYFIEKIPHEMYLQRGEEYHPEPKEEVKKTPSTKGTKSATRKKVEAAMEKNKKEETVGGWPMIDIF